jgi:hypothetical protein
MLLFSLGQTVDVRKQSQVRIGENWREKYFAFRSGFKYFSSSPKNINNKAALQCGPPDATIKIRPTSINC